MILDKFNAIEKCNHIKSKYGEYLSSSFEFGDKNLQEKFKQQLKKEKLFKGPYVDLNLPFKRGKTIRQLIDEGIISKSFSKLGNINLDRPLYYHQEESIKKIAAGKSVVITTGTGSGKTESFLFPILNDILKDIESGNNDSGIRAIFLYPMNALVNDQIDRVREILTTFPEIKYGFFTGETKETELSNYRELLGENNNKIIPENELLSRSEIRQTPPHLLFTNYSMLEYILIRPKDFDLFKPESLVNWKYVVLDEAHSYSGTKGIEISLLMRRLTGLVSKKPRFILTSATLGEQGKSEDEILEFARKLTSVSFDKEDIIFSKRLSLSKDSIKYRIKPNDYIELAHNINNIEKIIEIASKYVQVDSKDKSKILYELLSKDECAYEVFQLLKNESKTFNEIKSNIDSISDQSLICLIDLINSSEKDGIRLFDLKYHSFVRPLTGAYITFTNPVKFSLTKTNEIEGFKAFELGNCKYCKSPYIIGRIIYYKDENISRLHQNKEIDIYENYGKNQSVRLDYFLLDKAVDDEIENDTLEEYELCSKCGAIRSVENLNSKTCKCNNKYKVKIYRIKENNTKDQDDFLYNNIKQCPSCGHKSSSGGIVKSLNLGKDEGTALILQILLEAIDKTEKTDKKNKKFSLNGDNIVSNKNTIRQNTKQLLSFSDSRQQASFANVFFEANHERILRKRIIWEVIKNHGYKDLKIDELASYLTDMIKQKELFENNMNSTKNAWTAILVDLLKVDGANDSEGVALYFFDLDLSDIYNEISDEMIEEEYGKYKLTKDDFFTLMQVVLTVFKTTPAIDYVKSTLTEEEKKENLDYRRFDNYIMYNSPQRKDRVRSFLPINRSENKVVRYVKKACNCSTPEACKILGDIFNNLLIATYDMEGIESLVKKAEFKDAYKIDVSRYIVKNYINKKYYRCKKCGTMTPYNVHDVCIKDQCDGKLEEVNPDKVLKNNYYRNEYKNKKIERIVSREHTAQINRDKAKKYQRDFKDKKINILFCSTTFEMGIDLGNLETVFMRNVPPTPANYVQRAGRAGRRKNSSAFVLTYCGVESHDYTYFCEPNKMISGIIEPPYFDVMNEKIIIRHLMSSCLGFFFRKYPEYFNTINKMVFGDGKEKFENYINSHPVDLKEYIDKRILTEDCYSKYHNFKWFDNMGGKDIKLNDFVDNIKAITKEYESAKEKAMREENYKEVDYYKSQCDKLKKQKMLTSLSKYSVIPRYGFPVDVVELKVYEKGVLSNIDRHGHAGLSRNLNIAISEYAPDSEIIVDGEKYISKYITLPKTNEFTRYYFCECQKCRKVNLYLSERTAETCKYCGAPIYSNKIEYFIEPIYGFKTGDTKESKKMKPKRSYSGEVSYIGGGKTYENKWILKKIMSIETSSDDELMVLNKSSFYMCPECGYSEKIKYGDYLFEHKIKKHKNYRQFECKNTQLQKIRLGHRFKTDVTRLVIPMLSLHDDESWPIALSFLYSLLEGVSSALQIERTDINGILEANIESSSYDILLFDNVPGGAGHVKRLLNENAIKKSLKSALKKVSQECCNEDTSCYNCLRNYYNQIYHSYLKRKYAKKILVKLISEFN